MAAVATGGGVNAPAWADPVHPVAPGAIRPGGAERRERSGGGGGSRSPAGGRPAAAPSAPARATPRVSKPLPGGDGSGALAEGERAPVRRAVPIAPLEMAVPFDLTYRVPAKDQVLPLESERKADAMARFAQGLLWEDEGDTDKAGGAYQKSLALDPANTELALKLTGEAVRRGDVPAAIDLLKDTIKANPRQSQPYLVLAYLYYHYQQKTEQAQKTVGQALEIDPLNPLAYQYGVEIDQALGQTPKAQQLLERGARVESQDPNFWLRLGLVYAEFYLKEGRPKTPEDLKRTTAIFDHARAAAGDNSEVLGQVANFYAQTEQMPAAIESYQKVLRLDPSDASAADRLARCYLASGQRDKAAEALEQSIQANPTQQAAYELLGEIYTNSNQLDKAIDRYEQCLRLNPNNPVYYARLFELLLDGRTKRPERAVELLTQARQRFPDQPAMGERLAIALSQAHQHQQALTVFEQTMLEAQRYQPSLLQDGLFYFRYGAAAEQGGLYEKAATLLKKTLEVATDLDLIAETSNYLGYMWIDRGENLEEAGALVKRALEIHPESGAFLDSLGWYYYQTKNYDQALAQLLKAAAGMENPDPTVFEHLGDTYQQLKDNAQALNYWQQAFSLPTAERDRLAKKIEDTKAQVAQRQTVPAVPAAVNPNPAVPPAAKPSSPPPPPPR